jgi:uncharacterized membrane protein YtjA (UPF0391 family)
MEQFGFLLVFFAKSFGRMFCGEPLHVLGSGSRTGFAGKCRERGCAMSILRWALIMLVVSLVAALFGFSDLAAASADVARVLFYIFGVIFLVLLVFGIAAFRRA